MSSNEIDLSEYEIKALPKPTYDSDDSLLGSGSSGSDIDDDEFFSSGTSKPQKRKDTPAAKVTSTIDDSPKKVKGVDVPDKPVEDAESKPVENVVSLEDESDSDAEAPTALEDISGISDPVTKNLKVVEAQIKLLRQNSAKEVKERLRKTREMRENLSKSRETTRFEEIRIRQSDDEDSDDELQLSAASAVAKAAAARSSVAENTGPKLTVKFRRKQADKSVVESLEIGLNEKFSSIFDRYVGKYLPGSDVSKLKCVIDGEVISATDTPDDYDLEGDEILDVKAS